MGLYDYRPYVKRISNDRQIMFDCDREYRIERGRNILLIKIFYFKEKYINYFIFKFVLICRAIMFLFCKYLNIFF